MKPTRRISEPSSVVRSLRSHADGHEHHLPAACRAHLCWAEPDAEGDGERTSNRQLALTTQAR